MIKELDMVALSNDVREHGLREGDIGAVVHVYPGRQRFEVEFVTAEGETLAVLTLSRKDIRPFQRREILHVRELDHAAA